MADYRYDRCDNPKDCCTTVPYGKPADKPEDKGKQFTAASEKGCTSITPSEAGFTCKCVFILHYTEVKEPQTDSRHDYWEIEKEEVHGLTSEGTFEQQQWQMGQERRRRVQD